MADQSVRICVLTGAGASKPLGLPTMLDLLPQSFEDGLQGGERDVFDMVANWALAATTSDGILDFEVLFTAVDLLANMQRSDPISIAFAPPQKDRHGRERGVWVFREASPGSNVVGSMEHFQPGARQLLEKLKRVVHERLATIAPEKAANLYYPLFSQIAEIIGPKGIIDVFTTNYDRAVEASYEYEGKATPDVNFELVRGFSRTARSRTARWDPSDYQRSFADGLTVRLYKLHGSLGWRREGGRVVEVAADEYHAQNALIYPLRKPSTEEPFAVLLSLFEQAVNGARVCIVIGSSLRDEHIRGILVKRLKGDALRLVLVDPDVEKLWAVLDADLGEDKSKVRVGSVKARFGDPDSWTEIRAKLHDAVIEVRSPS